MKLLSRDTIRLASAVTRRFLLRLTCTSLLFWGLIALPAHAATFPLIGQYDIRDPSRIVKCHNRYYVYATGPNVQMRYSDDLIHWNRGQDVLASTDQADGVPRWAHNAVPGNRSNVVWAPDVLYFHGLYHLYYAFSSFGSAGSVIGLVTSPTLDPTDARYHWSDAGLVVRSQPGPGCNAIDPCPAYDRGGGLWLSYGSYNHYGIGIVQLNNETGLRISPNSPIKQLAMGDIEASYIAYHDDYYYLYYNIGTCCQGARSTYHILMGRSKSINGSYVNREGSSLLIAQGSPFLWSIGAKVGPGHVGIYKDKHQELLSFHLESNDALHGWTTLTIEPMLYSRDGWPVDSVSP